MILFFRELAGRGTAKFPEFLSDEDFFRRRNSFGRRNLNNFQWVDMTHKCENAVKEWAKEWQESTRLHGGGNFITTVEKSYEN